MTFDPIKPAPPVISSFMLSASASLFLSNLHVSFEGVDGASLLIGIGDIAVSSGSACSSASATPSHVLSAILGNAVPSASIRFGLGRFTTEEHIDYTIDKFAAVVRHLRGTAVAH